MRLTDCRFRDWLLLWRLIEVLHRVKSEKTIMVDEKRSPARFLLRLLQSVLAVVAGILVSAAPAVGVDFLLGAFDAAKPWGDGMFAVSTGYRALFAVAGGFVTAWLAPSRPRVHALVLGGLGTLAGAGGVVAYFAQGNLSGPGWYPLAVCLIALPCAWIGGRFVRCGKLAD